MKLLATLALVLLIGIFPAKSLSVESGAIYEESADLYWPSVNLNELEKIELNDRRPSQVAEDIDYKSVDELREILDRCWYSCRFLTGH